MSNPSAPSLSIAYKELINNLWNSPTDITYFSPHNFKEILGRLNPLFKDISANDSKDLVTFFLLQLHDELNNIDNEINNKNNNNNFDPNFQPDQYNKDQMLKYFVSDFAMNSNSIISQIFYGVIENMMECQNCKMMQNRNMIKYNYEKYFFLIFPLEEIRKYKISLNMNNNMMMNPQMFNIQEVNLIDCFNYYQKQNYITGYCNICNLDNVQLMTKTNIFSPPNTLVIILNRGKGLEFNVNLNFSEYLHLNEIIKNCDKNYRLSGVIKHLGDNSATGHFIAYCRSPVPGFNNVWHCYNDDIVVRVNDFNDILNSGVTYILFYTSWKNKA